MSHTAREKNSVQHLVSEEERQARVDLAAAYRLVGHYGWDDLIFTHLSVRVPGPKHYLLINPYGMMFEEITASSLVKINLQGEIVSLSPFFVNPAGFTIHSAVHAARAKTRLILFLDLLRKYRGLAPAYNLQRREPILVDHSESLFCLAEYVLAWMLLKAE